MKIYEASKILKKSNKDLIAEIGDPRITSHLSKIPEDILATLGLEKKTTQAEPKPAQTVDSTETVFVGTEYVAENLNPDVELSKQVVEDEVCPYTAEEIELGIRCVGNKGPHWKWRQVIGRA